MKVGSGDFVYEVIQSWGRLPDGWSFGSVPDGACDAQCRVYVFSRSPHPVMVFDSDGNFLASWGEDLFTRAHGIMISPEGWAYCADDKDHTVRKCTLDGKVLMTLGTKGRPSDTGYDGSDYHTIKRPGPPFNRPTSAVLSPRGEIYVSDGYGNCRVHKFSPDGRLLLSWGEPGIETGQFSIVHRICVDKRGNVYVADRENNRIQLFTPEGRFITQWDALHRPNGMFMGADGNLYVSEGFVVASPGREAVPPQVSIWDLQGKLLARLGGLDISVHGNFFNAHGLWGDSQGNLYVGEIVDEVRFTRGTAPAGYPAVHKLVRVR